MKKTLMKTKRGISTVSLVVTVVVLIILSLLAVYNSSNSIDSANKSSFMQELKDVEESVANKRITNQIYGTSDETINKGFYKVRVVNPPTSFVSFDKNTLTGYVVDLELVQFNDSIRGQKYTEYKAGTTEVVNFGKDDVYVYDANGVVYYARGVEIESALFYSAEELNADGPMIVSKMVNMAANKKSATIEVVVRAMADGKVSLTIGGKKANVVSENGNETTFSLPVYENKTYMLVASETENGSRSQSIDVTEIDTPTYKIIYDANGGINAPPQETKTENITLTLSLQSPTREGYTFMGWATKRESTLAEYKPGSEFTVDENTTLYAVWVKGEKTYNVLYSANGGTGAPPAEFNIKETYTISLQAPRKEGYGFDGWSTNPKAISADYRPGDVISIDSDIELYAVWISNAQTVTINVLPEGAGKVVGNGAKQKGENVVIAATANEGYAFESWKVVSGGATLANTVSSTTSFKMPAGDVTIEANFKEVLLTLKYDANGGYNAPATQRAAENTTVQVAGQIPTRDGYKFKGWALRSGATVVDYAAAATFELKESIVLYAVWEQDINNYTLSFDLNGGTEKTTGDFAPITTKAGEPKQIPTVEPVKKGFVFLGWALEKSSKDIVYTSGDTFEKDRNTTLYAIFKDVIAPEITMSVHYDNEQLVLEAEAFDDGIVVGYNWTTSNVAPSSWNADGTGSTRLVKENSSITNGENYFWAKDYAGNVSSAMIMVYEVIYDANGGENAPSRQLKAQGVPMTLSGTIPTRKEFKFLGWSTSVNPDNTLASVTYVSGDTYAADANVTLKAVWGQTAFELSSYIVDLAVGEPPQQVVITKSPFTGDLKVTTSDETIAKAELIGDIIKLTPGTRAGDATITVTESTMGTSRKILVRIEKGQRTITLTKDAFSFTYGDDSATTVISYEGEQTRTEVVSANEDVATASVSGYTITVTPHNFGTTKMTIIVLENDAYYEKTANIQVVVAKKNLIVTPDAGQTKVYDKTTNTPVLKYTYTGQINGETPKFEGGLSRAAEKDVGTYKIELGNLKLVDNGAFRAANYNLVLNETPVYFEITHMYIPVPPINAEQIFDATEKYAVEEGVDYVRGGVYAATDVGTYNVQLSLADTKNTLWEDTKNTLTKNFTWKIIAFSLINKSENPNLIITVDEIQDQVYTGSQITPSVNVKMGGIKLVEGNDYTLSYSNNVNVGTATVTITGKGNYADVITTTFNITNAVMQVDAYGYDNIYDGKAHSVGVNVTKPASGATIYYSETKLTSSNYTSGSKTNPTYTNVCTKTIYYYVVAPNFSPYSGNVIMKISPKTIASGMSVTGISNKSYTGSAITQTSLAVKDLALDKTLVLNTDYTVSYKNNKNLGTATITITGKGNYTGTREATFTITGDTITFEKDTDALTTVINVTIKKQLSVTTLQYSLNGSSWTTYSGPVRITQDGILYARAIDTGNSNAVIGTAQLQISNICEHTYVAATCTVASYCSLCGYVNGSPLGHSYTQQVAETRYLNTAATCTKNAIYNKKCVRCTAYTTASTFEVANTALGHDYNKLSGIVAKAATCTEPAYCYYSCTRCSSVSNNTYASGSPLGHDSAKQSPTKRSDATCTAAATYYYCCSRCSIIADTSKYYSSGTALGHAFSVKSQNYLRSSATCTAPATYYYECSRCGVSSKNNDGSYYSYGSTIAHSYTSKTTSSTYLKSAATCVDLAVYYYKCSGCSAKGTNTYTYGSVNSSNHVGGTTRHYTAPTTLATGKEWYVCNSCGVTVSSTTIPKLTMYAVLCSDNVLEFNTTGTSTRGKSLKATGTSWVLGTYTSASSVPWYSYASSITGVQVTETITPTSTAYWFYGCSALTSVGDLSKLDTSNVTTMANMFYGCSKLTSLNVSKLVTSKVTSMAGMFNGCSALTSLTVSTFNTAKVTDMSAMFKGCSTLPTLNISAFTTSAVTNMKEMFSGCTKLATLTLGSISTANVTNMSYMFNNCSALTSLTVTSFNTAKVTNMVAMFNGCAKLTTLDVTSFNTAKVTSMSNMFKGCTSLSKIYATSNFVTTAVTDGGSSMFTNDTSLKGGSGTAYSSSNVGKAYAKIDGGAASPGYFWSTVTCTHSFTSKGNNYLRSSATCTAAPTYYYECALCGLTSQGSTNTYYSSGSSLGHNPTVQSVSSGYLKSNATCTSPAVYYYKCSRCTTAGSNTYTYGSKNSSNHVGGTTTKTTTAATCTATGTKTTYCNGCGAATGTTSIAKLAHNYAAATCTVAQKCTVCGTTTGTSLGHNYSSATCTAAAKCTRCGVTSGSALGHSYSSATCTTPKKCTRCGVTSGTSLGHSYSAATCTAAAKCTRCSATSGTSLGHNYSSATCTKAATCTRCSATTGTALGHNYSAATCTAAAKCSRCGVTSGSALGHNYAAATCTVAQKCTRCGTTTGSSLGHNYSYSTTKAATCLRTGTGKATCSRCGYSYTYTIDKNASNHEGVPVGSVATEATCTRNGKINYNCSECKGFMNSEVVNAYGHNYINADCINAGKCSRCGATGSKNMSAHYGPIAAEATRAATCTTNGLTTYRCLACKNVDSTSIVAARGHNYAAATCTSASKCTRCTATTGDPLGHSYTSKAMISGCARYTRYTCSRCGYAYDGTKKYVHVFVTDASGGTSCTKCGVATK